MTLPSLQSELIPHIESELKAFLDTQDFGKIKVLKDMLTYHMGWQDDNGGGKRIRPMLCLLCAGALGADPSIAMPGALAVEFLHNFTLIHDDIEDNSSMRHGRPTLWQRWGFPQAINAGDALFSIAQMAILDLEKTSDAITATKGALKLNQVCLHLTGGQYLDIAFETDDVVGLDTYLEMIKGKTGALIALSGWLGGLAVQQGQDVLNALYDFGENLGLAFQIQDDLLGIWGDPQVTGKSAASDILTRKKTLPILFGLKNEAEFRSLWAEPELSPEQVTHMAALLQSCGAQGYANEQAGKFTDKAVQSLKDLFLKHNTYTKALFELTGKLLNRNF